MYILQLSGRRGCLPHHSHENYSPKLVEYVVRGRQGRVREDVVGRRALGEGGLGYLTVDFVP